MRLLVLLLFVSCAPSVIHLPGTNPALPYSKAVIVGDTVHLAGHIGTDPAAGTPPAAVEDELRNMLDGFAETMSRAGVDWDDLVRVRVFCVDPKYYEVFNKAYAARFKTRDFPVRSFIGSGPLVRGCRFEIDGTALRR